MVRNREEAARSAEQSTSNVPGTCQLWTRNRFLAPSAGDRDGDGDADAVDGWKSEPLNARHPEDRTPPRGVPVAFSGGSHGLGHRAISLGGGRIRSTDMNGDHYAPGHVGTTTILAIERAMGQDYTGWSDTITGQKIPLTPVPKPSKKPAVKPKPAVPTRVSKARDLLEKAMIRSNKKGSKARTVAIKAALKALPNR